MFMQEFFVKECGPKAVRTQALQILNSNVLFIRRSVQGELFSEDALPHEFVSQEPSDKQTEMQNTVETVMKNCAEAWRDQVMDCPAQMNIQISGPSRTGKSTLLRSMIKFCSDENFNPLLLCPEAHHLSKVPCLIDTFDGRTMHKSINVSSLPGKILNQRGISVDEFFL